jgi:predicted PurR-regulated permease PerM
MNTSAPIATEPNTAPTESVLLGRVVWLLWAIVLSIAVAFAYFASSLCVTLVLSAFLAMVVDPVVTLLDRCRLSRTISAALIVLAGLFAVAMLGYASYSRVSNSIDQIPEYTERIQDLISPLTRKMAKVEEGANRLAPAVPGKKVQQVQIKETVSWTSYIIRGAGPISSAVLILAVVPFMMYFCLIRKEAMFERLTISFGRKIDVPRFVNELTGMVRGFAIGNLLIGSVIALVTIIVLYSLRMPGAFVLGVLSGFLNLIPFIGAIAGAALPLAAGLLQFHTPAPFMIISLTVIALHIVSANLFIPKFIGRRVNIGPAAATAGILFWGWLWGPIGVLLAIPLTATVKLAADAHPSLLHLSNILAESPRILPHWLKTSSERFYRAVPHLRHKSPERKETGEL